MITWEGRVSFLSSVDNLATFWFVNFPFLEKVADWFLNLALFVIFNNLKKKNEIDHFSAPLGQQKYLATFWQKWKWIRSRIQNMNSNPDFQIFNDFFLDSNSVILNFIFSWFGFLDSVFYRIRTRILNPYPNSEFVSGFQT